MPTQREGKACRGCREVCSVARKVESEGHESKYERKDELLGAGPGFRIVSVSLPHGIACQIVDSSHLHEVNLIKSVVDRKMNPEARRFAMNSEV